MAAVEVMTCNTAVRNLIRENKIAQIYSNIQTGREYGMQTLARSVEELVSKGLVDRQKYKYLCA